MRKPKAFLKKVSINDVEITLASFDRRTWSMDRDDLLQFYSRTLREHDGLRKQFEPIGKNLRWGLNPRRR